jgi:hypothetical protein
VLAGASDIPGLTDENKPRSRGPKRASKIRKLYNLTKEDDVRAAAKLHGKTKEKDGKKYTSTVKIQRLVTPVKLQRKRRHAALKKAKIEKVRPRLLLPVVLLRRFVASSLHASLCCACHGCCSHANQKNFLRFTRVCL